jgi:thioredoxin 1
MISLHVDMLMQCSCSSDGRSNPLLLLTLFAGALLLFNGIKLLIKSKGISLMNKTMKITIVLVLIVIVGVVVAIKQQGKRSALGPAAVTSSDINPATGQNPQNLPSSSPDTEVLSGLPRLVDLGAGKCVPCKLMKPVLDELKEQYKGKMDVVFIDVWENPKEAEKYGINIIPTQIFYDKDGKELFRHEGFFSKEDILAKWKELGVTIVL